MGVKVWSLADLDTVKLSDGFSVPAAHHLAKRDWLWPAWPAQWYSTLAPKRMNLARIAKLRVNSTSRP
jgi:hypothetical protein